MKPYTLYIDGSSLGNPGPGGGAYVIEDSRGNVVEEGSKNLGIVTNNEAEYLALIMGLEALKRKNIKKIVVVTDSELLYHQLLGEYRLKAPNLMPLFEEVKKLLTDFEWNFKKVNRKENKKADQLAFIAATKGVRKDEKNNS